METKKTFHLFFLLQIAAFGFNTSHAARALNNLEMGATLLTTASEIAAQHYAYFNNKNQSDTLKKLSTLLSIANSGLFFYNNHQAAQGMQDSWNWTGRDCLGMVGFTLADLASLAPQSPTTNPNTLADLSAHLTRDLEALNPTELQELILMLGKSTKNYSEEEANLLAEKLIKARTAKGKIPTKYITQVLLFPILKGLTRYAIAATQNYATSWSGDKARFTATAAHAFTRLFEEYAKLHPEAKMKKTLIAALCANAIWLAYEGTGYLQEAASMRCPITYNTCPICKRFTELTILGCSHSACRSCLQKRVSATLLEPNKDHNLPCCADDTCKYPLTRNEIHWVVKNDPTIMHKFDTKLMPTSAERQEFLQRAKEGDCIICGDNTKLQPLGCPSAHAFCLECLRGHIAANAEKADFIPCPHPECVKQNNLLSRGEIACIVPEENTAQALKNYDAALAIRHGGKAALAELKEDNLEEIKELIKNGSMQICPFCQKLIEKSAGCNHMTCNPNAKGCGGEFCYECGTGYTKIFIIAEAMCPCRNTVGNIPTDNLESRYNQLKKINQLGDSISLDDFRQALDRYNRSLRTPEAKNQYFRDIGMPVPTVDLPNIKIISKTQINIPNQSISDVLFNN